MTNEALVPFYAVAAKIQGVTDLDLTDVLVFQANGHWWELRQDGQVFYLRKDGALIRGFTNHPQMEDFFK